MTEARLVTLAGAAVVAMLLVGGLWNCGPSQPPLVIATTQAEVTAYTLESQSCVTLAPTRADADVCLGATRARWCGPGAPLAAAGACDAGAPAAAAVVINDGGAQ